MKKIIVASFILLFGISCYEDKGNYTYRDVPVLTQIDSVASYYTRYSYDTLRINPVFTVNGAEQDEYDCWWGIYDNTYNFIDTIGREQSLNYIISRPPSNNAYPIILRAVSKTTGIEYRKETALAITSSTNSGWYLLKTTDDGNSDLDYFSNDESTTGENVLYNAYGYRLKGEGRCMGFLGSYYDKISPEATTQTQNQQRLFVCSAEDIITYNSATANVIRHGMEEIIYAPVPEVINLQKVFTNHDHYLINNGKVHKICTRNANRGWFEKNIDHPDGATVDYRVSPYTGGFYSSATIFFDEIKRSFLYSYMSQTKLLYLPNNGGFSLKEMAYDLIHMGVRTLSSLSTSAVYPVFALMKHITTGEYIILEMQVGRDATASFIKTHDIRQDSELPAADFIEVSPGIDGFYYIKDHTLKLYNIHSGEGSPAGISFPAGETITFMQVDRYGAGTPLVIVGTQQGEHYKVYILNTDLNTGKVSDTLRILEGKGTANCIKSVSRGIISI